MVRPVEKEFALIGLLNGEEGSTGDVGEDGTPSGRGEGIELTPSGTNRGVGLIGDLGTDDVDESPSR